MKPTDSDIENHYHRKDLYEEIVERLKAVKGDLSQIRPPDLAAVDEFHVRGAEVSQELAEATKMDSMDVLDVGCGLGGPSRMLANCYGCQVTGVDLSREYIRTASLLSALVGLEDRTTFLQANATDLPFENGRFDAVWTQHVQMNIPDKAQFYSEICRVLKKGGPFIFYEILRKGSGSVRYPMPWASNTGQSFLFTGRELEASLQSLGLKKEGTTDQTLPGIAFFESLLKRFRTDGLPPVGLHLLMGDTSMEKLGNLLGHLKDGTLELKSGIFRK